MLQGEARWRRTQTSPHAQYGRGGGKIGRGLYPAGRECGTFRQCCGRKRVHARVFTLCNSTRIAVLNSASLQQHWNALLNDIGIALIQVVKPLRSRPACRVLFAFLAEKHAGRRSEHTRHDGRLRQQQRRSRIHPGVSPRYFGPQRLGSVQVPRGTGSRCPPAQADRRQLED